MQLSVVRGWPVLLSFAWRRRMWSDYWRSFGRLLLDSGAFSAYRSGTPIDLSAYADWADSFNACPDAVAGLDDIGGDWRQSMKNYTRFARGFPTYHDTDPPELLPELVAMSRERGRWLGLGVKPRHAHDARVHARTWLMRTLIQIPPDIQVHGWALRKHLDLSRLDSVDSTSWFRKFSDWKNKYPWLTNFECVELSIKHIQRSPKLDRHTPDDHQPMLFSD